MPSEDLLHLNQSDTMLLSNPNVNTMNHVNISFRTMESPVTNRLITATSTSLKDYLSSSISLSNYEMKMIKVSPTHESTSKNQQQKVKKEQNDFLNLKNQDLNNDIDLTCTMFSDEKLLDDNDSCILDMDDSRRILDDDPTPFHNDNILFNSSKRQSCPTFLQGFSSSVMPMNVQSSSNDNWNEFHASNVALSNGYDRNNTLLQSHQQNNYNSISNTSQLERISILNDSGRAAIAPEDIGSSSSTACGKQNILLERIKQQSWNSPYTFPNNNNIHQIASNVALVESNHHTSNFYPTASLAATTNCQQTPIDIDVAQNDREENGKLFARLLEAIRPYIHDTNNDDMDRGSGDSLPPDSFEPNPL